MLNTTLADLTISAQTAGQKVFAAHDLLARESVKLEEFAASSFDRADYPAWEQSVNAQAEMLATYSKQPSPATIAARKAAAAAPAPQAAQSPK
jgi:hypothetical protein